LWRWQRYQFNMSCSFLNPSEVVLADDLIYP
jgi:hypothetical protein